MRPEKIKSIIDLGIFEQVDIRVGTIEQVVDIPESKVQLIVNFGDHQRSILAGIKKERDNPKVLEGKQALFIVNLEPRSMAGHQSQGMLLDIGYQDGILPVLATPEARVPDGARAG